MRRTAALFLFLVLGTFCAAQVAQEDSDCPPRTVINNGVCIGENGADCSKQEAQSHVCYDPDPQYTEKAAKASIKGVVHLTAIVGTDGCADKIKVVDFLSYGLDEAAVFALERFRFRKPAKPMQIVVEFDFDPHFSSRDAVTAPKCEEVAHRSSSRQ